MAQEIWKYPGESKTLGYGGIPELVQAELELGREHSQKETDNR